MMGKTHLLIGVSYGVMLLPNMVTTHEYTSVQYGAIVGGLILGSLLPDLDHPHSLISQQIPIIGRVVSRLTRHRGLFHSLLGVVLMFALSAWLSSMIVVALAQPKTIVDVFFTGLMTGYILHIIADMLTVSGVKLLYPLKKNIGIGLFKTGGIRELLLRGVLMGFCLLRVVSLLVS